MSYVHGGSSQTALTHWRQDDEVIGGVGVFSRKSSVIYCLSPDDDVTSVCAQQYQLFPMAPFDNVDLNVTTGILATKTLDTANMLPYGCDNSKNSNIWQQRLPLVTAASTATAQKYFLLTKQQQFQS